MSPSSMSVVSPDSGWPPSSGSGWEVELDVELSPSLSSLVHIGATVAHAGPPCHCLCGPFR